MINQICISLSAFVHLVVDSFLADDYKSEVLLLEKEIVRMYFTIKIIFWHPFRYSHACSGLRPAACRNANWNIAAFCQSAGELHSDVEEKSLSSDNILPAQTWNGQPPLNPLESQPSIIVVNHIFYDNIGNYIIVSIDGKIGLLQSKYMLVRKWAWCASSVHNRRCSKFCFSRGNLRSRGGWIDVFERLNNAGGLLHNMGYQRTGATSARQCGPLKCFLL